MLAIATRFHGPGNVKGSRYTASVMEGNTSWGRQRRLTINADHRLGLEENHKAAAMALIRKLEWTPEHGYGNWIIGGSEEGYVFVCDNGLESDRLTFPQAEAAHAG